MMRAAALLCGLGLLTGAALAQDQAPPPPPAGSQAQAPGGQRGMGSERRIERMKTQLNLTDDQTTQVKAIMEDSQAKMEAVRGNSALSQEDRRSQMTAIFKAEQDKVDAILTPDQKTKYDAMQARMRQRMQERQGGAGQGTGEAPPPTTAPHN